MAGLQAYLLRVAIGLDAFVESFFHFGLLGVTISSRIGTAAAHGHRWGKVGWWLLDRVWPFGCDQDGTPHCVSAIQHDIARGRQVVSYLTSDPIVNAYVAAHTTKLPYKGL